MRPPKCTVLRVLVLIRYLKKLEMLKKNQNFPEEEGVLSQIGSRYNAIQDCRDVEAGML